MQKVVENEECGARFLIKMNCCNILIANPTLFFLFFFQLQDGVEVNFMKQSAQEKKVGISRL